MSKIKKLTGSFRYTQWDPCLIISQIVAMQFVLYLTLSLLIALMQDLTSSTRTLDHLFEYHEIHVKDNEGRARIVAFVLNAAVGALVLWILVGRTKLCLDFRITTIMRLKDDFLVSRGGLAVCTYVRSTDRQCIKTADVIGWGTAYHQMYNLLVCKPYDIKNCTFYGIHLLFCWVYNGSFPTTFSWWALNIACAAITCVAGEFLCLRTELQAIPLSNIGAKVDL